MTRKEALWLLWLSSRKRFLRGGGQNAHPGPPPNKTGERFVPRSGDKPKRFDRGSLRKAKRFLWGRRWERDGRRMGGGRGSASGWRDFFPNGPGLAKRFIWSPIESSRVERMAGPKVLAGRWRSASCWSLRLKRFVSRGRDKPKRFERGSPSLSVRERCAGGIRRPESQPVKRFVQIGPRKKHPIKSGRGQRSALRLSLRNGPGRGSASIGLITHQIKASRAAVLRPNGVPVTQRFGLIGQPEALPPGLGGKTAVGKYGPRGDEALPLERAGAGELFRFSEGKRFATGRLWGRKRFGFCVFTRAPAGRHRPGKPDGVVKGVAGNSEALRAEQPKRSAPPVATFQTEALPPVSFEESFFYGFPAGSTSFRRPRGKRCPCRQLPKALRSRCPIGSQNALVFVSSLAEALHCGPGPGKFFFLNVAGDAEALRLGCRHQAKTF